jgi:hypothetical protein
LPKFKKSHIHLPCLCLQEVLAMDPQHRMLLEAAGELLSPGTLEGSSAANIQLKGTSGILGDYSWL